MPDIFQRLRIALVHDYFLSLGGAERVVLALKDIFPQAKVFALLANQKKLAHFLKGEKIETSFLSRLPLAGRIHRWLAPLMPTAIESFDLSQFDLVISSASVFAKGLVLRTRTKHICYCHSPTRFLWDYAGQYIKQEELGFWSKLFFHYLRLWDISSANRVDYFLANSKTTAQRIAKYYRQRAEVVYPPIRTEYFKPLSLNSPRQPEYYLIVSRLSPHKRIDLAIDAFNKLGLPLIIIGQGRHYWSLKKMAQKQIRFLGWQPDEVVRQYYQKATALILPAEEDLGLTALEAMACGRPVLAYRQGGATETVIEGITGEFFDQPYSESLADGLRRLKLNLPNYSPLLIRKQAERFSEERFKKQMIDLIEKVVLDRNEASVIE